jgi:hypothetical protein
MQTTTAPAWLDTPEQSDDYVNSAAGETCEQGGVDTSTCDGDCTAVACGDGYYNAVAEVCDTGGDTATCDANCTTVMCGDGYRNIAVEACDSGGVDTASCDADCTAPICGDGYKNSAAGEECDPDETLSSCTFGTSCDSISCRCTS